MKIPVEMTTDEKKKSGSRGSAWERKQTKKVFKSGMIFWTRVAKVSMEHLNWGTLVLKKPLIRYLSIIWPSNQKQDCLWEAHRCESLMKK